MLARVIATAALAATMLGAAPAPAATTSEYRHYSVSASSGSSYMQVMADVHVDPVTGAVTASNLMIHVSTENGSDIGWGTDVTIDVDPLLLRGRMAGQVMGQEGPLSFSLDFLGTQATTTVPYASAEIVPETPPGAIVTSQQSRTGRSSGTVSSAFGGQTVSLASAFMFRHTTVQL